MMVWETRTRAHGDQPLQGSEWAGVKKKFGGDRSKVRIPRGRKVSQFSQGIGSMRGLETQTRRLLPSLRWCFFSTKFSPAPMFPVNDRNPSAMWAVFTVQRIFPMGTRQGCGWNWVEMILGSRTRNCQELSWVLGRGWRDRGRKQPPSLAKIPNWVLGVCRPCGPRQKGRLNRTGICTQSAGQRGRGGAIRSPVCRPCFPPVHRVLRTG